LKTSTSIHGVGKCVGETMGAGQDVGSVVAAEDSNKQETKPVRNGSEAAVRNYDSVEGNCSQDQALEVRLAERRKEGFRVTIEPGLLVLNFSMMLTMMTKQLLALDKACRVELHMGDEICDAVMSRNPHSPVFKEHHLSFKQVQFQVQKEVAGIFTWLGFVDHAFPILFVLVIGAWSDKHGRKPVILVNVFFSVLAQCVLIAASTMNDWSAQATMVAYSVVYSLGGGLAGHTLGVIAFLSDLATKETKFMRIGVAMIASFIATPIASAASGPILAAIGFTGIYAMVAGLSAAVFIYFVIIIKETRGLPGHRETIIRDLFDISQVVLAFKVAFKARPEAPINRIKIIVLCIMPLFIMFPPQGEMVITQLFVRNVFNWSPSLYGYYNTFKFVTMFVGMFSTVFIFGRWLGFHDATIGVMGCMSQILAAIAAMVSPLLSQWVMFATPAIDIFNGANSIVSKALLTNVVPDKEIGHAASVVCVMEALTAFFANPLYSAVYKHTLASSFPGAVYAVTLAAALPVLAGFVFLYVHRKEAPASDQEELTPA